FVSPPAPRSTLFPYTTLFRSPFHEQLNGRIRELLGEAMRNGGIVKEKQSLSIADFIESIRAKSEENGQLTVKNRYKILRDDFVKDRKSTRLNSSHVKRSYAVF